MTLILNFVDTAGQERYQNLLPNNYIRDSFIVLLIFDNLEKLKILEERWYKFYKENANIEKYKFIVVANKSNQFEKERQKIKELGNKFSDKIDAFFITCSAKSNDNIDNLENIIVKEIKRLIDEEEKDNKSISSRNRNSKSLTRHSIKNKKGCC